MRVWVARAEPAALRTAERLRTLGHEPLVAPVLTVARTAAPVPDGRFDAILLTSANGVEPLAEAGAEGAPVFAVGRRTAERAQSVGLTSVIAADGDATALAALLRRSVPPGSALLHVAGEDRKAEPAASLRAAGYVVSTWTAYAARPVEALPKAVARALSNTDAEWLRAALHYSRRSAAITLALARAAGLDKPFSALNHYCLSPDVAVPLVEAGIPAHFVPARPDEDSLLSGLPDAR